MAAELDAQAKTLAKAGKRDEAIKAILEAEVYDAAAAEMERIGIARGHITNQRGTVSKMVNAVRLRVSKGRSGDAPDPLVKAAHDAGFTLRSLVEKLRTEGFRVSHPFLNQARKGVGHKGPVRIRATLARRIEALIGFRATKANWPGGWAREPSEER